MINTTPFDDVFRIQQLQPRNGILRMILDTDTFNEIDDQFAVVHALASPDRLKVEALYAAPFHNNRSSGPGDGMTKSYDEIQRLLGMLPSLPHPPVLRGATQYLDLAHPQQTEVTEDLIRRAKASSPDDPLYVVAIGAITNVAAAILVEPAIVRNVVVVWLGGHALHWSHTREFNLKQDIPAARVVLDSGVPLVLLPCVGVVDRLATTNEELAAHLAGKNALADYLVRIVREYNRTNASVWSKVIWDVAATAWMVNPNWVTTTLASSPIITDNGTWSFDNARHLIRIAREIRRDTIFSDCFGKIARLP